MSQRINYSSEKKHKCAYLDLTLVSTVMDRRAAHRFKKFAIQIETPLTDLVLPTLISHVFEEDNRVTEP